MSDRVIIFDTTLRDGEQALSASLNPDEKLKIALALEELGVDVMEVGFPISSPGDFSAVNPSSRPLTSTSRPSSTRPSRRSARWQSIP